MAMAYSRFYPEISLDELRNIIKTLESMAGVPGAHIFVSG
jgi:hypothetical protein